MEPSSLNPTAQSTYIGCTELYSRDEDPKGYPSPTAGTFVARGETMQLPRWQRHWWEWTAEQRPEPEPNVLVDPSLFVEPPTRRPQGTMPPPSCIGPYCIADPETDD